jgi:hypothetical protein
MSDLFDKKEGVNLFEKPYWGRPWTIQEVLLARHPIPMCGNKALPWSVATAALSMYESTGRKNGRPEVPRAPD